MTSLCRKRTCFPKHKLFKPKINVIPLNRSISKSHGAGVKRASGVPNFLKSYWRPLFFAKTASATQKMAALCVHCKHYTKRKDGHDRGRQRTIIHEKGLSFYFMGFKFIFFNTRFTRIFLYLSLPYEPK
jgi:hypothetical protein